MTATATTESVSSLEADALIVGITADGAVAEHPQLTDAARAALDASFAALEASGKLWFYERGAQR